MKDASRKKKPLLWETLRTDNEYDAATYGQGMIIIT